MKKILILTAILSISIYGYCEKSPRMTKTFTTGNAVKEGESSKEELKVMDRDLVLKRIGVLEEARKKLSNEYKKIQDSLLAGNKQIQELTQKIILVNGGIAELQLAIGIDPNKKEEPKSLPNK